MDKKTFLDMLPHAYNIESSRKRLQALPALLANALEDDLRSKVLIRDADAALKRREQELVLAGVEGKNEKECEAALSAAKWGDVSWVELSKALSEAGGASLDATVALDALGKEWTAVRLNLQLATAIIGYFTNGNQIQEGDA